MSPSDHLDQFDIEDQCCEGRDLRTCATLAVSQTIGDEEAVLSTLLHQLQTLCPSSDHLLQGEGGRLTTLIGTVEDGTVDEGSLVVAHHRILRRWLLAVTLLQHLILKAAGQRDDAVFLGILCEILLTSLLMHLALLGTLGLEFLLLLLKIFLYNHLSLTVRHLQLVALKDIVDGLSEVVGTDSLGTHLCQLLANAKAQSIT